MGGHLPCLKQSTFPLTMSGGVAGEVNVRRWRDRRSCATAR
jgi:hypothetical protein